jgi:hypothetical protein
VVNNTIEAVEDFVVQDLLGYKESTFDHHSISSNYCRIRARQYKQNRDQRHLTLLVFTGHSLINNQKVALGSINYTATIELPYRGQDYYIYNYATNKWILLFAVVDKFQ